MQMNRVPSFTGNRNGEGSLGLLVQVLGMEKLWLQLVAECRQWGVLFHCIAVFFSSRLYSRESCLGAGVMMGHIVIQLFVENEHKTMAAIIVAVPFCWLPVQYFIIIICYLCCRCS